MRGIEEKAPLVPVNGISKNWVRKYLARKKDMLLEATERGYEPF
jgi:hypothetical protein